MEIAGTTGSSSLQALRTSPERTQPQLTFSFSLGGAQSRANLEAVARARAYDSRCPFFPWAVPTTGRGPRPFEVIATPSFSGALSRGAESLRWPFLLGACFQRALVDFPGEQVFFRFMRLGPFVGTLYCAFRFATAVVIDSSTIQCDGIPGR